MLVKCITCVSHAGEMHAPGAEIEVSALDAARLTDLGAAERVLEQPPALAPTLPAPPEPAAEEPPQEPPTKRRRGH